MLLKIFSVGFALQKLIFPDSKIKIFAFRSWQSPHVVNISEC